MRILYCSLSYPPHLNGQSIFTKNLAEGMAKRGHEVVVLAPGETGYPQREAKAGIQIRRAPTLRLVWIHQNLRMPVSATAFLQQVFKEFQPDLVHLQDPSPFCRAAMLEAQRWNIPVLITHHPGPEITAPYLQLNSLWVKNAAARLSWKLVIDYLNRSSLVTVPSRYSADMLVEHGLQVGVQTIPCGVELAEFQPNSGLDRVAIRQRFGLDPEKPLFLYVGRIDIEKNLDVIIKALAIAKRSDVQFAIAGQGSQEANLRQLAVQIDVDHQVHFLGPVNHAALPDLLNSADIFVMPGKAESFSIATLEAMACAKPVLAAKAAALPELVAHFVNGYLFRPDSSDEAAAGLKILANSRDRWLAMGKASMARARCYGLDHVLQSYERGYQACLKQFKIHTPKGISRTIVPEKKISPGRTTRLPHFSRIFSLALMILLICSSVIFYDRAQAYSHLHITDLRLLNLESLINLLVVSPHPDDEMLAAGGLIQKVLETGGTVEVAMVTNGDGQYITPFMVNHNIRPSSVDYIDIGRRRQVEALTALEEIGLHRDNILYLGYPDGRINSLWSDNWQQEQPIKAPYTRETKSPYENTYNPEALYLGSELYQDLRAVLENYRPDMILVPHPEDNNSDHSAVSNFARFAIADYLASGNYPPPTVLAYLVHYGAYPVPRGDDTGKTLLPPAPLSNQGEGWLTLPLSEPERANKKEALHAYFSQQRVMPTYLQSFARANEIFFELPVIELPVIGLEDNQVLEENIQNDPTRFAPSHERFDRLIAQSIDIEGWKVSRIGNLICFGAETRGPIRKNVSYRVLAKLPDGDTLQVSNQDDLIMFTDHLFGACFGPDDLGDPSTIGFSAEAKSGFLVDHTAWQFVYITHLLNP